MTNYLSLNGLMYIQVVILSGALTGACLTWSLLLGPEEEAEGGSSPRACHQPMRHWWAPPPEPPRAWAINPSHLMTQHGQQLPQRPRLHMQLRGGRGRCLPALRHLPLSCPMMQRG